MILSRPEIFRIAQNAVAVACGAALCAGCLTGCRYPEKLVQTIYDQNAEEVDYDNPQKIYRMAPAAEQRDPDVAEPQPEPDVPPDEVEKDLPETVEAPQTPNPAPRTNPGPVRSNTPAGSASGTGQSAPTAPQKQTPSPAPAQEQDQTGPTEVPDSGDSGGENPVAPVDPGTLYDATYGLREEAPPACATLVAAADCAELVVALGGGAALVGTAADVAGAPGAAALGLGEARAVFAGDGLTPGEADVDAIIALAPEGVLVSNDTASLSADDRERIVNAGINVVALPSLRSASGLRTAVDVVGGVIPATDSRDPRALANAYLGFYDDVIAQAQALHGGGWADGRLFDGTARGEATSQQRYSLYIAGWDDDATVQAQAFGTTFFLDRGVAYTHRSYQWSPLSTFMSAGGVVNNAATFIWGADLVPVLQYNENAVSYTWEALDVPTGAAGGSGLSAPGASGGDLVMTNARGVGMLGDAAFPAVIVRTPDIAAKLEAARANPNGLYTPCYDLGGTIGRPMSDGRAVTGYARADAGGWSIVVNPAGFLGSWADGGMESVIEALWVAETFHGDGTDATAARVREFYETFHGRALDDAEVANILSGAYALPE